MRSAFAISLVAALFATEVRAEDGSETSAPTPCPLFHPDGPGRFRWRFAGGLLMDILPTRVVENQTRQVPMITGHARLGLPAGFSTDLRLSAIVITNDAQLGVGWTGHVKDFAFAIQNHIGVWYGFIGVTGFDATGFGSFDQPGLSLGIPWKRSRFTLTGELIVMLGQHTKLGDSEVLGRTNVSIVGTSLMFTVESFFANDNAAYYGLGILRTLPNYEAWVAFSDSRSRLPYPRFVAGYEF